MRTYGFTIHIRVFIIVPWLQRKFRFAHTARPLLMKSINLYLQEISYILSSWYMNSYSALEIILSSILLTQKRIAGYIEILRCVKARYIGEISAWSWRNWLLSILPLYYQEKLFANVHTCYFLQYEYKQISRE